MSSALVSQMILTLKLTDSEAGATYATLEALLEERWVKDPIIRASLQSVVKKLKAAQKVAVVESVVAEMAEGTKH